MHKEPEGLVTKAMQPLVSVFPQNAKLLKERGERRKKKEKKKLITYIVVTVGGIQDQLGGGHHKPGHGLEDTKANGNRDEEDEEDHVCDQEGEVVNENGGLPDLLVEVHDRVL